MTAQDEHWWALITERPMGPRESRVQRNVLRLRSYRDAQIISTALKTGVLRRRPGVDAWVQQWR